MTDELPRSRVLLSLPSLSNAIRALHCIDLDVCQQAGLFQDDNRWPQFRDDPVRFFLHSDDATQEKLWSIVLERTSPQPGKIMPDSVAAAVNMQVTAPGAVTISLYDYAGCIISPITVSDIQFTGATKAVTETISAVMQQAIAKGSNGGNLQ